MVDRHRDNLQLAARHLLQQPLTCAEHNPEVFAVIRRHEQALGEWFTQRLGYRLQVTSSTARLYKNTVVPHRPLLQAPVGTGRSMSQRECTLLVLILAAVAAGPRVISLRDLINDVRSQASDADITLSNEASERRALVVALKWMIKNGLLAELHEHIDNYEQNDNADAILEINFDRIGLLPLSVLARATDAEQLFDRSERRTVSRQWMRAMLSEYPVLYRSDVTDHEWSELRRRLGEEVTFLDEMFGLRLESRAEGIAAIDPNGQLSDRSFPTTGTLGHAALLVIDCLVQMDEPACPKAQLQQAFDAIVERHKRHWSKTRVEQPQLLLRDVIELLDDMRLLSHDADAVTLLPAALRYSVKPVVTESTDSDSDDPAGPKPDAGPAQTSLW